jgi:hypothetical protein
MTRQGPSPAIRFGIAVAAWVIGMVAAKFLIGGKPRFELVPVIATMLWVAVQLFVWWYSEKLSGNVGPVFPDLN